MQVREIMSSPPITVGAETKIPEIARLMCEHQISGVPVVDGHGQLLGLITELAMIERNAPLREPRYWSILSGLIPVSLEEHREYREQVRHVLALNAQELMNPEVQTVAPDAKLDSVMQLMMDPAIISLPVIEDGAVIGVITRTDLVRVIERLEMAVEQERPA
ncbi:MAG: CBS domain-containing protein [Caldilineaceae bacterium]|nr:CBS domain-containing protein [Caldilineaceae bacterium]